MDSVVHFELPAENMDRAQKFYKSTFGWIMKPEPGMEYRSIITGEMNSKHRPLTPGYINGGMPKKTKLLKYPLITINVANVDKAIAKTVKNGGKIVAKKLKVGEYGYLAYIKDTEGNIVGLWQNLMKM